jgi:hypothetical protein
MRPDPHLAVRRIQEDVRERGVVKLRSRNRAISASSPPQIRDTSDLETPDPTPNAATRSSTLRVETPCT